ncbi:hypothetical protein FH968_07780 [Buttiauxella sp. B2]|uniref:hypothetical protein n=1 Tax=Buttiauxella sp. B2 TaxID=2587812 RepID=UPI001122A38A|nr:hypothetical protein [Buttiauxella sp. B2]TNV21329.1 hypothetical protein FH968_07780 [Buttiauxella sp. B2]
MKRKLYCFKAAFAGMLLMFGFVVSTAHATDQSQQRQDARGVRQDTRDSSRGQNQDCIKSNNKSNSDCRQDKHQTKQDGRQTARQIKY